MPKFLEEKLEKEYAGKSKEERNHAVYGTMNKLGFMKGSKETKKGEEAEKKHKAKKKALESKKK